MTSRTERNVIIETAIPLMIETLNLRLASVRNGADPNELPGLHGNTDTERFLNFRLFGFFGISPAE